MCPERLSHLSDRELLVINTEDTKLVLSRVDKIEDHLEKLNGKVADTMVKLAKAEEIAKTAIINAECANATSTDTNKRFDSWARALIVASIGAIAAVVVSVISIITKGR